MPELEAVTALAPDWTVDRLLSNEVAYGRGRDGLLGDLNAGFGPMVYFVHASQAQWSETALFTGDDAYSLLGSPQLPPRVSMTCLTGLFHDVYVTCIAKKALVAPQGPVATWASMGFAEPRAQPCLCHNSLAQVAGPAPVTFGEAAVAAKRRITDRGARCTWTLFGDPTMRLK